MEKKLLVFRKFSIIFEKMFTINHSRKKTVTLERKKPEFFFFFSDRHEPTETIDRFIKLLNYPFPIHNPSFVHGSIVF